MIDPVNHESHAARLMVVDDQEPIRKALRSLLTMDSSFQVCGEAYNGSDAVKKALELEPQVILMDISMPEMDGLEATRRILKSLPEVEILIFTQHATLQAAEAAKNAGARGCLSKSEAAHLLIPALKTVSRHQPFFPSEA